MRFLNYGGGGFDIESISRNESICNSLLTKGGFVLYKKFQALLEKRNETVYQVSKETGISQTAFSNWKSGRTSPNIDSLKKLSKHFNVPIEYFVGIADEEGG